MKRNEIIDYHFGADDSASRPEAHAKVWKWLIDNMDNIKIGKVTYGNYFDKCKEEGVRIRFSTLQFYQAFGLICRIYSCEI